MGPRTDKTIWKTPAVVLEDKNFKKWCPVEVGADNVFERIWSLRSQAKHPKINRQLGKMC